VILGMGATGQLGFAVVSLLRKRGEEVTALVRPRTDPVAVRATGARVVPGDLRDRGSLRSICEGVQTVVATANTIVPRPGERPNVAPIAEGYAEVGHATRAAGVQRFLFVSVPREFMGRGSLQFDAKGQVEAALAADGPPLTIARSSLFIQVWLPHLGSRLPLRGSEQATLERGYWLTRLAGATTQRSLERFGVALLPGDGSARHTFISIDDVAGALVGAATAGDAPGAELRLGGPAALSWLEVTDLYGRVLDRHVRTFRQPTALFRTLSAALKKLSPAASDLLAMEAIVATVDVAYPPDDVRRLLGRDPTSVEAFLRQRLALA
jgi:uncharacterized protein YbjT (DUF2867 family)